MTRRLVGLLLLSAAAGCGSGRLVPSESPEPSYAPSDPTPVSEPAVATQPAPQAAPAPAPTPTSQAPAPASAADPNAAGYAPSGYAPYGGQLIQIRRIGQYSTSGITTPARLVIRDDSSYASFWTSLGAGARPAVDFSRDIVIVAAAGQRATGGNAIAVERVSRTGDGLAVEVVETNPGPGCMTTQALTQPVDVIVVAAADARTWSFSDQTRAQPCQ
jgi:hypothetical protein